MDGSSTRQIVEARQPVIGVVVPVFSHSGLLVEALDSLFEQAEAPPFAVALINDGCAFQETDLVGSAFAALGMENFHYIRRRNGGLSAARNTGIDFLLDHYPGLEAIYFLDADNRLEPYALQRMARALGEHPEGDWFYPDIEMFGLTSTSSYGGDYSRLTHVASNISEAGSVVRRRVFDAGVRFDQSMRQGYEDWEFWLSALDKGFVGQHLPYLGFRYRKRPESMLADSHRDDAEIKSYIKRKHRGTYGVSNLLRLEAEDAPRYAIVLDDGSVMLALDPRRSTETIPFEEYGRRFWAWMLRIDHHFAPPFVVCMSRAVLSVLQDSGVLTWVLWDLEQRLRDSHTSGVGLQPFEGEGAAIAPEQRVNTDWTLPAHVVMAPIEVVRGVVKDVDTGWWNGVVLGGQGIATNMRMLQLSDARVDTLPPTTAVTSLFQAVSNLHNSPYRGSLELGWTWANSGKPERHVGYRTVRAAADQGVVYPREPDGRRHVAMLCSFADFGGVEKVAYNVARELRAAGFVPHLVLFRTGDIRLPKEFDGVFESLLWVTAPGMLRWDGPDFNGTRLSWWSKHGDTAEVVGLLAGFDAAINCQSGDAHGVMAQLRRRGVVSLTHQHIVEHSRAGRAGGSAVLAKAFEHSYDGILTCSAQLKDWFVANGVPQEKLLHVQNAPSYAVSELRLASIANARAARLAVDAPLRVLFMARFDGQKGVDRVIDLIKAARREKLDLHWRAVGKAVVDGDGLVADLEALIDVEPPVYEVGQVEAMYAWADVIVLPSRYEGVPLTLLEAMRTGAVVLAADAGAVREIVDDAVDGFVVPQEDCVPRMLDRLRALAHDKAMRARIGAAASVSARRYTWRESVAPVAALITQKLARNAARLARA
jgi:glycosyltransferase involved in cell wall biosynthesis